MRPKFSNPFILRVKLSQLLARFLSHESEFPHELPNYILPSYILKDYVNINVLGEIYFREKESATCAFVA